MSRRALESFPELSHELNDRDEIANGYQLWFELLPLAFKAHRDEDEALLRTGV